MGIKKGCLCVKLKLPNREEKYYVLAEASLEALAKYTTYCKDAGELLALMPSNESVNAKSFLQHFAGLFPKEDTFVIASSDSPRAKKSTVLYKQDQAVLLVSPSELKNIIIKKSKITLDECEGNLIPKEKEEFLKELGDNFVNAKVKRIMSENAFRRTSYDGYHDFRYDKYIRVLWMALGLVPENITAMVEEVFKDFTKRQKLMKLIEHYFGSAVFDKVNEQASQRIQKLEEKLHKNGESSFYIRKQICSNVRKITGVSKKTSVDKDIPLSGLGINDINNASSPQAIRADFAHQREERLEESIKGINGSINEGDAFLRQRLLEFEYQLQSLRDGWITFSDAGFPIEREERTK